MLRHEMFRLWPFLPRPSGSSQTPVSDRSTTGPLIIFQQVSCVWPCVCPQTQPEWARPPKLSLRRAISHFFKHQVPPGGLISHQVPPGGRIGHQVPPGGLGTCRTRMCVFHDLPNTSPTGGTWWPTSPPGGTWTFRAYFTRLPVTRTSIRVVRGIWFIWSHPIHRSRSFAYEGPLIE